MKKILFAAFTVICLAAWGGESPKYWPIAIKDTLFQQMELATTPEATERGLMFRKSIPDDGGMLFYFKEERIHRFWMRNTLIPLDIIFIAKGGKVTAVYTMNTEPPRKDGETDAAYIERLPTYSSIKPAIAAIELNAGMADAIGIKAGDTIDIFPGELDKIVK